MIQLEGVPLPWWNWLPLPFLFLGSVVLTLAYDYSRRADWETAKHFWIHWWHAPLLAFCENVFGLCAFLPIAFLKTLLDGPFDFTLHESVAYVAVCCLVIFAIASLLWIRRQNAKWTTA